jgi:hypothetical protein
MVFFAEPHVCGIAQHFCVDCGVRAVRVLRHDQAVPSEGLAARRASLKNPTHALQARLKILNWGCRKPTCIRRAISSCQLEVFVLLTSR